MTLTVTDGAYTKRHVSVYNGTWFHGQCPLVIANSFTSTDPATCATHIRFSPTKLQRICEQTHFQNTGKFVGF